MILIPKISHMTDQLLHNSGPNEFHKNALKKGKFMIQHCTECSTKQFIPRSFCITCNSESISWVEAVGTGTVYSKTTVRRKVELGGDYNVSLVDLDEGVRVMANVVGIAPENVQIDMRVKLEINMNNDVETVIFKPGQ